MPVPATSPTSDAARPSTDPGPVAARLRLGATRLARRLRQEVEVELTPSLHSALVSVRVHGPLTLGELAQIERVTPPTVTKLVGRLEEQGLVDRHADPDDRRVCRVAATTRGEALLAESREAKNAWLAQRLDQLMPEDVAVLDRAAALIEAVVEDRLTTPGDADGETAAAPTSDPAGGR